MITERLMSVGRWDLSLRDDTPRSVMDKIEPHRPGVGFGLLVITPEYVDPTSMADADILKLARYAGPIRTQSGDFDFAGAGMNLFMGDENDGGRYAPSVTTPVTFAQWAAVLLPSFLTAGITSAIAGNFDNDYARIMWARIRDEVCARFTAEWRVNPNLTLDIGVRSDLFKVTPNTMIVRKDGGRELGLIGIQGELEVERDLEDWTREVQFISGSTPTVTSASGGVAANAVPYRAPDGTAMQMTRIVTAASTVPAGSETAMANAEYAKASVVHEELTLKSGMYDVGQDVRVGDNLYVFDPLRGLQDDSNRVLYRGEWVNPTVIRCVGYRWPVRTGMGVYLRRFRSNGTTTWPVEWVDLTRYVLFEDGAQTSVDVGSMPRPS